ncbi:hypothetical protein ACFWOJ_35110 [Streptomyces sp. NPDC058439]|uniref:hypothetical protein n=1 Tax=Streptomyces sp. NPDC058439 TaxID=3346500 RepID=UPI003646C0B2
MLGFAAVAALFLPGVAYLGITNDHRFIDNAFFAFMYYLAGVSFAAFPLLAWRRGAAGTRTRASAGLRGSHGCSRPRPEQSDVDLSAELGDQPAPFDARLDSVAGWRRGSRSGPSPAYGASAHSAASTVREDNRGG